MCDYKLESLFSSVFHKTKYIFFGTYIRGNERKVKKELYIDLYVIVKTIIPFVVLLFSIYTQWIILGYSAFFYISIYSIIETLHYNILHIMCLEEYEVPRSYKRNIILGFCNYLEVVANFGIIYASTKVLAYSVSLMSSQSLNWIDYLYFSFVAGGTLGFGDIVALGDIGHLIVIAQIVCFIIFFGLFITHNVSNFINKPIV